MNKTLVLFHSNCLDGICAAWVAHQRFGDDAIYIPVQYGANGTVEERWEQLVSQLNNEPLIDRDIFVLDFSFPPDIAFKLYDCICSGEYNGELTILDHHKTAMQEWEKYLVMSDGEKTSGVYVSEKLLVEFDMTVSGALLAYKYFFPRKSIPDLVKFVSDRDLWEFKYLVTRSYCAGLRTLPMTIESMEYANNYSTEILAKGNAILEYQQGQVDAATADDRLRPITINGITGLATNCNNNISEVGEAICKKSGTFSCTFFVLDHEYVVLSFRSRGEVDVAELAKSLSGGGHRGASGAKITIQRFFSEFWK